METIDYYFVSASPFSYLGLARLREIAAKHGCRLNFKPVEISQVWANSGSIPLPQRSEARKSYRLVELQRIAYFHNICLNAEPKHFPTDPTLVDLCICAIASLGEDPADFALAAGRAVWERELNIADREVVRSLLEENLAEVEAILELAQKPETASIRDQNSYDAIAANAIGVPAYVYKGEVFWGQDRLEYLDHMIATGRAAFG